MSSAEKVSAGSQAGWEATLRALAKRPAPAGLEARVHAVLHAAPRGERVLVWPTAAWWASAQRFAAAAAIVAVVSVGGWSVYHRAQREAAKSSVAPAPAPAPVAGGFAAAGAKRVPQTLVGAPAVEQTENKPEKKSVKKLHPARTAGVR